jgi:hypothetical protein
MQQAVAALREHSPGNIPTSATTHDAPPLPAEPHPFPLGASSPPRLAHTVSSRHLVAPLRRPDLSVYFSRGSGDLSDPTPARVRTRAIGRQTD